MDVAQGTLVGAFKAVEERLEMEGTLLSEVIASDASTIFYLMKEHESDPISDEDNMCTMVK